MKRLASFAAVPFLLFLGLARSSAFSNTLSAPDTVYAGSQGEFAYRFTVRVEPDSTRLAGIGWNNGDNVSGAVHGDCFCFSNCDYGPGEELQFDVAGNLIEPSSPGTVENWAALCLEPSLYVMTVVMPHITMPALPVTWGILKARYR
jgi:hypothetical protein